MALIPVNGFYVWTATILIRKYAAPFEQGFFIDDQSLMHPIKESTISALVLYGVGFGVPFLTFMLLEGVQIYPQRNQANNCSVLEGRLLCKWCSNVYIETLIFFFGAGIVSITTNIGKYAVGRLRPHFITLCEPDDWLRYGTTKYFLQTDICLGENIALIQEARLSFPSGHASASVYGMMMLVMYIQVRVTWKGIGLLKTLIQTIYLLLAQFTCLSRISDYKHHWSDVLAGAVIGISVAVVMELSLLLFCCSCIGRCHVSVPRQFHWQRNVVLLSSNCQYSGNSNNGPCELSAAELSNFSELSSVRQSTSETQHSIDNSS